jgi:hypothetical protein
VTRARVGRQGALGAAAELRASAAAREAELAELRGAHGAEKGGMEAELEAQARKHAVRY